MIPSVRAVMLTGYVEVARHVGLDPHAMLRQLRISPDKLEEPENRLPAASVIRLLEVSASESGCGDFGLLMAQCRTFASLGPVSLLLEHLSSLREVVHEVSQHRRHFNDILVLGIDELEGSQLLRIELLARFAGPQACILTLAVAQIALIGASRGRWHPQVVHFKHAGPKDLSRIKRFFSVPVEFGSQFNGFTSSRAAMTEPFPWANEAMAQHARRLLALVELHPEDCPWMERVSRSIILLLPGGRATLKNVADNLGTTERTLQRELEREKHSFAELLKEIRRELSNSYLSNPGLPITSIAELLGYSSPSSFTRWFADEFGASPRDWRRRRAQNRSSASAMGQRLTLMG